MLVLTPQCNSLYLHGRFRWVIVLGLNAQSSLIMVIVVSIHQAFYYSGTVYFKEQSHQGLLWLIRLSKTYVKCKSRAYQSQRGENSAIEMVTKLMMLLTKMILYLVCYIQHPKGL